MRDGNIDGLHPDCVGVKAGGNDDALHFVQVRGMRFTLCGMNADTRNTEVLMPGLRVPVNDVCWTCGREGKRLLTTASASTRGPQEAE